MIDYIGLEWNYLIGDEFEKDYMIELSKFISTERESYTVYPADTLDTLKVFRVLQPRQINVVIMGQDPYPDGSYNGMAFSNSGEKSSLSPSLLNILREVESDVYGGFYPNKDPSLIKWQEQGVFLLNRILTVRKNQPNSHADKGWEKFTAETIYLLSRYKKYIVYMLWGNKAKEMIKYIDPVDNLILTSGHPSPLSANRGLWFGNKHFSKANKYFESINRNTINW
jgi:uracil-DNA glycosylase